MRNNSFEYYGFCCLQLGLKNKTKKDCLLKKELAACLKSEVWTQLLKIFSLQLPFEGLVEKNLPNLKEHFASPSAALKW